jgi:hypothetical protein
MLPDDGPVFVDAGGSDNQAAVTVEPIGARQIFANQKVARIGTLHVMSNGVTRLI